LGDHLPQNVFIALQLLPPSRLPRVALTVLYRGLETGKRRYFGNSVWPKDAAHSYTEVKHFLRGHLDSTPSSVLACEHIDALNAGALSRAIKQALFRRAYPWIFLPPAQPAKMACRRAFRVRRCPSSMSSLLLVLDSAAASCHERGRKPSFATRVARARMSSLRNRIVSEVFQLLLQTSAPASRSFSSWAHRQKVLPPPSNDIGAGVFRSQRTLLRASSPTLAFSNDTVEGRRGPDPANGRRIHRAFCSPDRHL